MLSKKLFSTLGDLGLEGPANSTFWSKRQEFSIFIGDTKPSLTLSSASRWVFFLFWLRVVDMLLKKDLFLKNSIFTF